MIGVLSLGLGNVKSVVNMVNKCGGMAIEVASVEDLLRCEKIILPGVGSFDYGMNLLSNSGLLPTLNQLVLEKKIPVLGICLGMQLMCNGSDEGNSLGLGWVNADVKSLRTELPSSRKVPHMGWNSISVMKKSPLSLSCDKGYRFYFVHSYYVHCYDCDDVLFSSEYGINFTSGFQKENIFGVQFHPEKSHVYGMSLISSFCEL